MTWEPRVIQGGATPSPRAPLSWEHVDDPSGRGREVISARWWTETGLERSAIVIIVDGHLPARISGTEPDHDTLRELAADVERWHEVNDHPEHYLESASGALYHS